MWLRVIEKHISSYPNPISFVSGDTLTIGHRDDEYSGWIRVTTPCGNEGWAPEQYIDENTSPPIAIEDYSAKELNTQPGEHLDGITLLNEWIWAKNPHGEYGWVPLKTTEVIP